MAQIWDGRQALRAGDGAPDQSTSRLEMEVGYGLARHGGAGLLTYYAGLSMAGSGRTWRAGCRLMLDHLASLGVEGRQVGA